MAGRDCDTRADLWMADALDGYRYPEFWWAVQQHLLVIQQRDSMSSSAYHL
jgi:hypothetical protein